VWMAHVVEVALRWIRDAANDSEHPLSMDRRLLTPALSYGPSEKQVDVLYTKGKHYWSTKGKHSTTKQNSFV